MAQPTAQSKSFDVAGLQPSQLERANPSVTLEAAAKQPEK